MTLTKTTLSRVNAILTPMMEFEEPPAPDQQLFYVAKMESTAQARERGNAGLDSLDRVEAVMLIEEEFGLVIPDCDVADNPSWNTAEGIAAYIDSRLEQARG
jgi:acyl carrier protein